MNWKWNRSLVRGLWTTINSIIIIIELLKFQSRHWHIKLITFFFSSLIVFYVCWELEMDWTTLKRIVWPSKWMNRYELTLLEQTYRYGLWAAYIFPLTLSLNKKCLSLNSIGIENHSQLMNFTVLIHWTLLNTELNVIYAWIHNWLICKRCDIWLWWILSSSSRDRYLVNIQHATVTQ